MGQPEFLFLFLSVGAVAMFSMVAVSSWAGTRYKERAAFYRADVLKKIAESQAPGAESALALLREQERQARIRRREGLRIGGLVNLAVGIGVMIFLHGLLPGPPIYLCGLIPSLIGVALIGASFLLQTQLE